MLPLTLHAQPSWLRQHAKIHETTQCGLFRLCCAAAESIMHNLAALLLQDVSSPAANIASWLGGDDDVSYAKKDK